MISVIIPTWNRGHNLRKVLTALTKQEYQDFEVIIVDDKSTDGTPSLIEEFKSRLPNFIYIYNNNRPTWDCARPRNIGIKIAKGELICILDSDIVLSETALKQAWEDYTEYPERIILGRYDWLKENFYPEHDIMVNAIDTLMGRPEYWVMPDYRREVFETVKNTQLFYSYPHALNCLGGHIYIPRAIYDLLGTYDEEMQMVEDGDFGIRSWKVQIRKSYDNRIRGYHLAHEIDPQRNLKAAEQLKKLNQKHFQVDYMPVETILNNQEKWLQVPKLEDRNI